MLCYKKQQVKFATGEKEISRKREKSQRDLEFYRDSTTGFGKYKHKYQPREKNVTNTSLSSATEEGDFTIFLTVCFRFLIFFFFIV